MDISITPPHILLVQGGESGDSPSYYAIPESEVTEEEKDFLIRSENVHAEDTYGQNNERWIVYTNLIMRVHKNWIEPEDIMKLVEADKMDEVLGKWAKYKMSSLQELNEKYPTKGIIGQVNTNID